MPKKRKTRADLRREVLQVAAEISANGGKPKRPPKPKKVFQYLNLEEFEGHLRDIRKNPPPMPHHEQKNFEFYYEIQKLPTYSDGVRY